ncbi:MAG: endolytic transglycosylase MltG [Mesorhizobium sp.]|nr:MAG: endolytic transglycosylase MltG [Mesorhizobium sp.]
MHGYTNARKHQETGPLVIEKGDGVYVEDIAGNRYIEAMAGLWSVAVGFSEKRLVEAATRQMSKLPFYHDFGSKAHSPLIDLAEKLVQMAPVPMSKAYFTNSGSEANDTAIKMIWYRSNALGQPARKKIISRKRGYHGVTIASASLTGLPNNHLSFDLPIANIDDFVTLASIVEKETGRSDERSRVAAVFLNRLAKGMRLQSDPTIIYGLFGGKGKPADRPIYQSDLDKQTPYNTYLVKGLPPTPIANPGRAALEAVANPSKTSDLYFVADGNGGHVFAATLEEHNQNVARYRTLQKKQADAAAKASGQTTAPAAPDGGDAGDNGDSGENGDAGGDAAQ